MVDTGLAGGVAAIFSMTVKRDPKGQKFASFGDLIIKSDTM